MSNDIPPGKSVVEVPSKPKPDLKACVMILGRRDPYGPTNTERYTAADLEAQRVHRLAHPLVASAFIAPPPISDVSNGHGSALWIEFSGPPEDVLGPDWSSYFIAGNDRPASGLPLDYGPFEMLVQRAVYNIDNQLENDHVNNDEYIHRQHADVQRIIAKYPPNALYKAKLSNGMHVFGVPITYPLSARTRTIWVGLLVLGVAEGTGSKKHPLPVQPGQLTNVTREARAGTLYRR